MAKAADYPEVARAAIKEMYRQVGDLVLDEHGLARGDYGAALVMPGGLDETREILRFLASEVSPDTFVNVMPNTGPKSSVARYPAIARPLTRESSGTRCGLPEKKACDGWPEPDNQIRRLC